MIYSFDVQKDRILLSEAYAANTGNLNFYECLFNFDDVWEGLEKFATFICEDKVYTVLLDNCRCCLPYELLLNPGTVAVGVFGSSVDADNPLRISTDFSHIVIKDGAYREATAPPVPEAAQWEIYFNRIADETSEIVVNKVAQYLTDIDSTLKGIDSALDAIIEIQNSLLRGEV